MLFPVHIGLILSSYCAECMAALMITVYSCISTVKPWLVMIYRHEQFRFNADPSIMSLWYSSTTDVHVYSLYEPVHTFMFLSMSDAFVYWLVLFSVFYVIRAES